jgi:hypothetical protein
MIARNSECVGEGERRGLSIGKVPELLSRRHHRSRGWPTSPTCQPPKGSSALSSIGLHLLHSNRSFPFSPTQWRDKREIWVRFAQRREGRNPLHFERVDYSVVVKNRAPLRNRGDGFIELELYQLYQLKECFLARALRSYDIWKSMNYNDIRMPLDPDMRTRNFIQIIKRDVNYPRYGNKKRRSLHPGGKIVCHHLGSPLIIWCRERTPKL